MLKKIINIKAIFFALNISFAFTLFSGCFLNSQNNAYSSFTRNHWYYINRGYPMPWNGVALENSKIILPLIKAPLISLDDGNGTKLIKIINLDTIFPIYIIVFLISYVPSIILVKTVDKNKKLLIFLVGANILILLFELFVYFNWFSST